MTHTNYPPGTDMSYFDGRNDIVGQDFLLQKVYEGDDYLIWDGELVQRNDLELYAKHLIKKHPETVVDYLVEFISENAD